MEQNTGTQCNKSRRKLYESKARTVTHSVKDMIT